MKHFKIYELDLLSDPDGYILQGLGGDRPMDAVCGIREKRGRITVLVNQDHPTMRDLHDRDWVLLAMLGMSMLSGTQPRF